MSLDVSYSPWQHDAHVTTNRQAAAEDPVWKSIQAHEFVPYLVSSMPSEAVFNAWIRETTPEQISSSGVAGLMHPDRLVTLRDLVLRRPLMSEDRMIEWGNEARDPVPKTLIPKIRAASASPKKKSKSSKVVIGEDVRGKDKALSWAQKVTAPSKIKEMRQELHVALEQQRKLDEEEDSDDDGQVHIKRSMPKPALHASFEGGSAKAALLASSPLAKVRVGSSKSTKLNYILNEVSHTLYSPLLTPLILIHFSRCSHIPLTKNSSSSLNIRCPWRTLRMG
jgi:hypothetical protein